MPTRRRAKAKRTVGYGLGIVQRGSRRGRSAVKPKRRKSSRAPGKMQRGLRANAAAQGRAVRRRGHRL